MTPYFYMTPYFCLILFKTIQTTPFRNKALHFTSILTFIISVGFSSITFADEIIIIKCNTNGSGSTVQTDSTESDVDSIGCGGGGGFAPFNPGAGYGGGGGGGNAGGGWGGDDGGEKETKEQCLVQSEKNHNMCIQLTDGTALGNLAICGIVWETGPLAIICAAAAGIVHEVQEYFCNDM